MIYIFLLLLIVLVPFFIKKQSQNKAKIQIEMIPSNQHYKNVRAVLTSEEWTRITKLHSQEAKDCCEICGKNAKLECHEIWSFNESSKVQKLEGMTAICHECHGGIHYGHTIKHKGKSDQVNITHNIMKVNNWTSEDLQANYMIALDVAESKSNHHYTLDLTLLNQSKYRRLGLRKFTEDETKNCNKKVLF